MFVIVSKYPIKLQNGLLNTRVEEEQRTHSGDEIDRSMIKHQNCISVGGILRGGPRYG